MTKNQIDYWNYVENARHNQEMESETHRSNVQKERETRRSNVAKEREQTRSNRANESINAERNVINQQANQEQARHNYANELAQVRSLDQDRERINLGYVQAQTSKDVATINAGVGYAGVGATYANIAEMQRSHLAQEQETTRSHLAQENISTLQTKYSGEANALNARTRAGELALKQEQWNTVGRDQANAQLALTNQQALTQVAQRERMASQNRTDLINAGANVLGSASRLLNSFKGVKSNAKK